MRAQQLGLLSAVGLVRHIEVNQLWLQDKVAKGIVRLIKVGMRENATDHLTKANPAESIRRHMMVTGQRVAHGRHHLVPYPAN